MTSVLPRWAAALVATELRLARFAARAPSIIASVRHASASSYSETSKWEGLAILLLVSFLPDAAVLWLLPIPLWGHLAVLAALCLWHALVRRRIRLRGASPPHARRGYGRSPQRRVCLNRVLAIGHCRSTHPHAGRATRRATFQSNSTPHAGTRGTYEPRLAA
jgi:hypothetical protein